MASSTEGPKLLGEEMVVQDGVPETHFTGAVARRCTNISGFQGGVPPHPYTCGVQVLPLFLLPRTPLPIQCPPHWPLFGTEGIYQGPGGISGQVVSTGHPRVPVYGYFVTCQGQDTGHLVYGGDNKVPTTAYVL